MHGNDCILLPQRRAGVGTDEWVWPGDILTKLHCRAASDHVSQGWHCPFSCTSAKWECGLILKWSIDRQGKWWAGMCMGSSEQVGLLPLKHWCSWLQTSLLVGGPITELLCFWQWLTIFLVSMILSNHVQYVHVVWDMFQSWYVHCIKHVPILKKCFRFYVLACSILYLAFNFMYILVTSSICLWHNSRNLSNSKIKRMLGYITLSTYMYVCLMTLLLLEHAQASFW